MDSTYQVVKDAFRKPTVYTLYLCYAAFYLPRKCDSVVKSSLVSQGFSVEQIAFADTVYLFTYTVAIFLSGMLGSKFSSNKLLSGSLLCLALISILKSTQLSPASFVFVQIFHAIFQSVGWPTCIKVLSVWISGNRGLLMGLWTTCQSIGGIIGAILASYLLNEYSFSTAYLGHVPALIFVSYLCYHNVYDELPYNNGARNMKKDAGNDDVEKESKLNYSESFRTNKKDEITMKGLFCNIGIMSVGVSYFFLKFLRYALLMWLPFYFEEGLKFDGLTAGYMSSSFECGGLFGTPFIGYISDNFMNGNVSKTASLFMFLASACLIFCNTVAQSGVFLNAFVMFLVGVLVIGPDSVMSGTVIQDLVLESGFSKQAVGNVAGFINSMGSCGSIFQSAATAYISTQYGWNTLFTAFVGCSLLSSGILAAGIVVRQKRVIIGHSKD